MAIETATHMKKQGWYIIGAGAIGCLWAAYWRRAGVEVVLITQHKRPGNTLKLTVKEQSFEFPVQCLTVKELKDQNTRIDQLLITTKAQDTIPAMRSIADNISSDTTLICLQNGMAGRELADLFAQQNLLTAITSDGAYRSGAMDVTHAGHGTTWLGYTRDRTEHASYDSNAILDSLPTAYLDIQFCNDIVERQWNKLAINSAINALTVIHHCNNGELLNNPQALATINALCQEFDQVASAAAIEHHNAEELYQQVQATLRTTADNFSSMYQDIHNKKLSEIDFINGAVCQLGQKHNIPTPHNQSLVDAIKALSVISE